MLLAIDTATHTSGLALYDQDGLHLEQTWLTSDNHTVELMPYIVHACEQQGLSPLNLKAVAVAIGPGSFTGLRVGLSVAKGLALALAIPIFGVPTLDALAYAHSRETLPVCAILQAGRGRLFVALYRNEAGKWGRRGDYKLLNEGELSAYLEEPTFVCGEMGPRLVEALRTAVPERVIVASPAACLRRPGYLAELSWKRFAAGEGDSLAALTPLYLHTA